MRSAQSGFTLFELLVVLAVVATVAGIGVQVLTGVTDDAEQALARAEMDNIASAIQRFRRDTGYWPKQGPFYVATYSNPADLSQLRVAPVNGGNPILEWDTASGTGWNGPYLRELDAAQVRMGGNLGANGAGDPTTGTRTDLLGYGDPFSNDPIDMVPASTNENNDDFVNYWFKWEDVDNDGDLDRAQVGRLGRPYLYFLDAGDSDGDGTENWDDPDYAHVVNGCHMPCLVSMGPDGTYNQGGGDDIVVNIAGHQ